MSVRTMQQNLSLKKTIQVVLIHGLCVVHIDEIKTDIRSGLGTVRNEKDLF